MQRDVRRSMGEVIKSLNHLFVLLVVSLSGGDAVKPQLGQVLGGGGPSGCSSCSEESP